MTTAAGVRIVNLNQFRAALRTAESATTGDLVRGLKVAGAPLLARAKSLAPSVSGLLRESYKLSVRGTNAAIVNSAPYASGAEWGLHGKWRGFTKYPPASGDTVGRFAWRAVKEGETALFEAIAHELEGVITIAGWAR
jgi:hypothetical protein